MKKFLLLLILAMLIVGCSSNGKKVEKNDIGQAGIANISNSTQSKEVSLKKRRDFKGIVSPFITKSPFEGTWIAERRNSYSTFAQILTMQRAYDSDCTRKYMEVSSKTNKYVADHDHQKKVIVYDWKSNTDRENFKWQIHDFNESANVYRVRNKEYNRDETWTYNAVNNTIQFSYIVYDNKIQTITYKKYDDSELLRIRQHAKEIILSNRDNNYKKEIN